MEKSEYISRAFRNNDYVSQEDKEETYEIAKRELFLTIYSSDTSKINENTKIPYVYEYLLKKLIRRIISNNISSTAMATIDTIPIKAE